MTDFAKKRVKRLERARAYIIFKACQKGSFIGFERCKSLVPNFLLTLGAELPRVDPLDESLKVKVNNNVKMFAKGLDLLPPNFRIHQAT